MLDADTRTAILKLSAEGRGKRFIAEALGISRNAVKRALKHGAATVAAKPRAERAEPFAERILALYTRCEGNLVRVHGKPPAFPVVGGGRRDAQTRVRWDQARAAIC